MSIISFNTLTPGTIGIAPRIVQLEVTDNLATLTTAGYLNRQGNVLQGFAFYPTDIILTIYSYVVASNSGTFGIFIPSVAGNGTITLTEWTNPGDVLLPVVSGDIATFNGTSGQIQDSGILATAVQLKANIKAAVTPNIGAGGAGPISVAVTGMTASSVISGAIATSSNPVSIEKMVATSTGFNILFSGDPGATCTVNYVAFIVAQ